MSLDVLAALALAAEEVALAHSLAMCPVLPQKRQSRCSKRRLCSSLVSLPSLPSLVKRSEDPFGVPELFKELGLGFWFFLSLDDELELEPELDLPLSFLVWGFSRAISERHSQ